MDLFTFLLAVLMLELTPGPNMAYLATLALMRGRAAGLIATAGVALGLAVHAIVSGLGAGVLIQRYPLLYDLLRWVGVVYLLYLAWEGWRTEKEISPERTDLAAPGGPLFLRGFLSNVFNPKSILFFVSVLPPLSGRGPARHRRLPRWLCLEFSTLG
jgi:threonine/homoserine/homoserine lactone efflux protein